MRMHVNVRTLCLLIVDISLACSAGGDSDDDKKKSKDPGRQDESGEIKGPTGPTKPVPTMTPAPEDCNYKQEKGTNRIVNGVRAGNAELPWQVRLEIFHKGYEYTGLCGGTLISAEWILSASHCFQDKKKKQIFKFSHATVTLGDTDAKMNELCEIKMENCKEVIRHDYYKADGTFVNDIALLRLTAQVPLNVYVNIAELPNENFNIKDKSLVVSGFGNLEDHAKVPALKLFKAVIKYVDHDSCAKTMNKLHVDHPGYIPLLPKKHICAFAQNKSTVVDACQGDSGGPLVWIKREDPDKANQAVIVGVVSYGYLCATRDVPGVYTDVRKYIDFIKTKVGITPP